MILSNIFSENKSYIRRCFLQKQHYKCQLNFLKSNLFLSTKPILVSPAHCIQTHWKVEFVSVQEVESARNRNYGYVRHFPDLSLLDLCLRGICSLSNFRRTWKHPNLEGMPFASRGKDEVYYGRLLCRLLY